MGAVSVVPGHPLSRGNLIIPADSQGCAGASNQCYSDKSMSTVCPASPP